jgi:F-type H+-transporting ATPase subunit b
MTEYLQSSEVWVCFSFLIFLVAGFTLGRGPLFAKLDAKIAEVKKEIDAAAALRQEAQDLLELYRRKQQDAEREAQIIIENARKHAVEIGRQADAERKEILKRREQQTEERLRRMEDAAFQEIRAYAADLAVKATTEIIAGKMDEKTNARLVEQSVKQVAEQLG